VVNDTRTGHGKKKKAYQNIFATDKTAFDERDCFFYIHLHEEISCFQQRKKSSRSAMFSENGGGGFLRNN